MNEFEQILASQPLKKIPDSWRQEILSATKPVGAIERNDFGRAARSVSWWHSLFWPHPKAWAGLAAVWVFVFILNFSTKDRTPVVAEKSAPPSPEIIAELKQQKLLFAELIGANDLRDADRPKVFLPRPRSERMEILVS